MGRVYRARDARLGRDVAIKVSHEVFSDRFEREARAAAAVNHPNIAQLYDIGPNYLVMELVDGTPIAPTDDMRRLLDLAIQIADGLAAAHAAGLLHRDLKPDNILVTGPASTHPHRVKVLEFGLAKSASASDADVTRSGAGWTFRRHGARRRTLPAFTARQPETQFTEPPARSPSRRWW